MTNPVRLGCGDQQVIVERPRRPAVKNMVRRTGTAKVVVPVPGPPGKDAEVVLEGAFNYTHTQLEPLTVWEFANPLQRQITSCRVIYPTTPDGETVMTRWDTSADGMTVYVDNKYPATGRAIIS